MKILNTGSLGKEKVAMFNWLSQSTAHVPNPTRTCPSLTWTLLVFHCFNKAVNEVADRGWKEPVWITATRGTTLGSCFCPRRLGHRNQLKEPDVLQCLLSLPLETFDNRSLGMFTYFPALLSTSDCSSLSSF